MSENQIIYTINVKVETVEDFNAAFIAVHAAILALGKDVYKEQGLPKPTFNVTFDLTQIKPQ